MTAETAETAGSPEEPGPAPDERVDDLDRGEMVLAYPDVVAEVRTRAAALERMPDGPRPATPRTGQELRRRQRFIVDWQLQVSYLSVYVATFTLLLVGFVALNFVFTALYERALKIQEARPFGEATDTLMLLTGNAAFVLLLLIGMAVYAIIHSHRVAGPALRFRRALRQMLRRDYDFHLKLRRRDYLQDLAEHVNVLNNALKAKDLVIASSILKLDEVVATHPAAADRLRDIAADLGEVVLPAPEPPEAEGK